MANTLNVSDSTKGEQLSLTSNVNFTYGVNSPFPEEQQAPVPSANFTVGGDALDNLYRMDNVARIEQHRPNTNVRERVFGGRFSTSSDANIGQMSVSHASNELNKDIRTWPIIRPRQGADTSNGRRVLIGALRHWYSECNLTEFGVRGDFQFATSNFDPCVAYYDHPTMRFVSATSDLTGEPGHKVISWLPILPTTSDVGASFRIGEEVTFVMKINNAFGRPADGEVAPRLASLYSRFFFTAGRTQESGGDLTSNGSALFLEYQYNSRRLYINQADAKGNTVVSQFVLDNVPGYVGTPSYISLRMVKETQTRIHYYIEFHHTQGKTYFDFTSTTSVFSDSLALVRAEGTSMAPDTATTSLNHEGVQGLYMVKGKTLSIVEEDAWEIQMPYFNKPKWKNISVPSRQGNAWQLIHELCSVYGLVFNPVHNTFLLNESVGKNEPWPTGVGSDVLVQASTREIAETVEVWNYNYSVPSPSDYVSVWKADRVFSVELGQRLEETIQLPEGTSLLDISQPVARSVQTVINWWKLPDSANVNSVYSVYDDDNLEVDPRSWNENGGFVSIEHTENIGEVKLIVQAPSNPLISKTTTFHLSIAGSDIPSLLIAAVGMRANKEKVTIATGAGKARNLKKVGTEFDSPLVFNTQMTYNVGAKLASLYGTTQTKASGTFPPIESHDFPTFPVLKRGSYYRPTGITDSANAISIGDSVRFNPVEWVQDNYQGITCGEFEQRWAGSICREVHISPLGKDHF